MSDIGLGAFSKWLAATSLSHTIQTTGWIIPSVQTVHILCVATVFFSAIIVDLRIWRILQRDVPVGEVARRHIPIIWPVLAVLLLTGGVLIVGEPRRSLLNTTFYLKMGLLAVAIVLTAALQRSIGASPGAWEGARGQRIGARLTAVVSVAVWCGILFAGRWIAYTQAG